ncbi:MAG: dTDP-4-dehydrorhamnose 3,5-epimerase [Anaerolineales bacterium]|jgi:dTDP-4-dehydrorhamnose 3,5-epimerase|nr:dTDP-4-dehydrorhamnose 3,5-epimerase [Anaerolineales bacterium]
MIFTATAIPDVIQIDLRAFKDERGFFLESYRADKFSAAGIGPHFVQDNHSGSKSGILRGLHYQIHHSQGKLVRVIAGEIFDVAVDLRKSSPTFGKWIGLNLSAENNQQLWIPPGLAHGFYVISDWAEVMYKTTDYYAPEWERTLLWNDPAIGVEWPLVAGQAPLLSTKDRQGTPLQNADLFD